MILTEYYKGEKLTQVETRYDITASTGGYDFFENILINKRKFNIGGLSFNFVDRPTKWKGKQTDKAITKGSSNITTVKRADLETNISYGDINTTNDGCIILYNEDFKSVGINTIEIFIARGYRNDQLSLKDRFEFEDLKHEVEILRAKAVTKK
jgi:hypothetical protein